jgi:hypothetical protein
VLQAAFRPTDSDVDGISVYRPECGATAVSVATDHKLVEHYVASLLVSRIVSLNIDGLRPTVIPTHNDDPIPGHASIPELNVDLRDNHRKQYRIFIAELAKLVSVEDVVHRPGSPATE